MCYLYSLFQLKSKCFLFFKGYYNIIFLQVLRPLFKVNYRLISLFIDFYGWLGMYLN